MENQIFKTGDICPECDGRIALVNSMVYDGKMDTEPYENGVVEGDGDIVTFEDPFFVTVHACAECGKVFSKCCEINE